MQWKPGVSFCKKKERKKERKKFIMQVKGAMH